MSVPAGLVAATVPFAAGAALPAAMAEGPAGGPVLCPFRAITGMPCPLCGSTRAFTLLMHGDASWTSYNAVVVVVVAAFLLWQLLRLARGGRLRAPPGAWQLGGGVAALGLAWAWTLSHADTITA